MLLNKHQFYGSSKNVQRTVSVHCMTNMQVVSSIGSLITKADSSLCDKIIESSALICHLSVLKALMKVSTQTVTAG